MSDLVFKHNSVYVCSWATLTSGYANPSTVNKLNDTLRSDTQSGGISFSLTAANGIPLIHEDSEQQYNCFSVIPVVTLGSATNIKIAPYVKNPHTNFTALGVKTVSAGNITLDQLIITLTSSLVPEPISILESLILFKAKCTGTPTGAALDLYVNLGRI